MQQARQGPERSFEPASLRATENNKLRVSLSSDREVAFRKSRLRKKTQLDAMLTFSPNEWKSEAILPVCVGGSTQAPRVMVLMEPLGPSFYFCLRARYAYVCLHMSWD